MEYTLRISKSIENPDYIKPSERTYGFNECHDPRFIEKDVSFITVDDVQFKKIQREIVEILK